MDLDSGDSDFYGDDETVSGLHVRVNNFDAQAWLRQNAQCPSYPLSQKSMIENTSHLHNPYAGVTYAWQLTESVDAFLQRLPPATTLQTHETPWIFICNPYIPRVDKSRNVGNMSKGNEDEAPGEEGGQLATVVEGGAERLGILMDWKEKLEKTNKRKAAIEKELNQERKQATQDILNLAHAARIRTGKWMLFCPTAEVSQVWEVVAKATANNELGIAAKVAPKSQAEDVRKDRLICVYTADFKDTGDVGRVLQRLRELRLVETRGRPIYYKPDAFTYIGLGHGNHWGLRASIYSSADLMK